MRKLFLQYQLLVNRFPILKLFIIIFITFSPIFLEPVGAYIWEQNTGYYCNERNCPWAAVSYYIFITLPIGAWCFISTAYDLFRKNRKKKSN